jgi:hypothetical protein
MSYAGTIVIKPGKFDHFSVQMPEEVIAGENFIIQIQAYDIHNNLIADFSESGKEFTVSVSGAATVRPSNLKASSFTGGHASIAINSKNAGKLIFSLREAGGSVSVISGEINVLPNKIDHFILQTLKQVTAGQEFDVRVIAKDLYDNTVSDPAVGKNVSVSSTGTSSVVMTRGGALNFRNGTALTHFMADKTGSLGIEIQDTSSGSVGQTEEITVLPSSLSYFKLQTPKDDVKAGDAFEVLIVAYDAYDNVATNYSTEGNGVEISATGSTKIEPSSVNPSAFTDGKTKVQIVYEKAEQIQIVAKEHNKKQTGKSALVSVSNSEPDHFVVSTPDTAVSGQKFNIKVEAYDRFKNIVKNYNIIGPDVMLETSGSGNLSPSLLSPSSFSQGVAMVDVSYDKAESFQIAANLATGKPPIRTLKAGKREIPRKKTARKKTVTKTRRVPKKPEKEESAVEGMSAKEYLEQIRVSHVAPEASKTEDKKDKITRQPKKAPEPKTTPVKPVEPTRKKPVEVAKKEITKVRKPAEPFKVSNISIIEAKDKAMLVINITNPNGDLEYSDEIESKYGKEWLKLQMSPALYKTEKAFKFKSSFVGEVLLEAVKDKKNVLNVYVELLPSGVTFDIARVRNTLIVTIASP